MRFAATLPPPRSERTEIARFDDQALCRPPGALSPRLERSAAAVRPVARRPESEGARLHGGRQAGAVCPRSGSSWPTSSRGGGGCTTPNRSSCRSRRTTTRSCPLLCDLERRAGGPSGSAPPGGGVPAPGGRRPAARGRDGGVPRDVRPRRPPAGGRPRARSRSARSGGCMARPGIAGRRATRTCCSRRLVSPCRPTRRPKTRGGPSCSTGHGATADGARAPLPGSRPVRPDRLRLRDARLPTKRRVISSSRLLRAARGAARRRHALRRQRDPGR